MNNKPVVIGEGKNKDGITVTTIYGVIDGKKVHLIVFNPEVFIPQRVRKYIPMKAILDIGIQVPWVDHTGFCSCEVGEYLNKFPKGEDILNNLHRLEKLGGPVKERLENKINHFIILDKQQ